MVIYVLTYNGFIVLNKCIVLVDLVALQAAEIHYEWDSTDLSLTN